MGMTAIFLFLAAVIAGGGLVAYALVTVPRLVLSNGIATSAPRWSVIAGSYVLSLAALKLFGMVFPNWPFLLSFTFAVSTIHHLGWSLSDEEPGSALAALLVAAIAIAVVVASMFTLMGSLFPGMTAVGMMFT